jgi:hypothetical protein
LVKELKVQLQRWRDFDEHDFPDIRLLLLESWGEDFYKMPQDSVIIPPDTCNSACKTNCVLADHVTTFNHILIFSDPATFAFQVVACSYAHVLVCQVRHQDDQRRKCQPASSMGMHMKIY